MCNNNKRFSFTFRFLTDDSTLEVLGIESPPVLNGLDPTWVPNVRYTNAKPNLWTPANEYLDEKTAFEIRDKSIHVEGENDF